MDENDKVELNLFEAIEQGAFVRGEENVEGEAQETDITDNIFGTGTRET